MLQLYLLDMFQIHIGLADFCRSEAEARAKTTARQYIYPQLGFTPLLYCKPPYGVVTQTLDNSEKCCWLVPVVFPLRIGEVFHVKSCVSAVIDLTCFIF